jgi:hypothetical protein
VDSELSRLIDSAAEVGASGRWKAANKRVEQLATNPGKGNEWWVQVLASLCEKVFSEYLLLKHSYEEPKRDSVALLAWRARNLLELSVWSIYCSKSKANARRFYEDAGRDVFGLFSAFTKWGVATSQNAEWRDPLAGAMQDLSRRARAEGINSLDGPYKQVRKAAEECGLGEHFNLSYKMFSKFAHPTAMQILAVPDEEKISKQKDQFFSQGCLFFRGAFEAIEGQLLQQSP